MIAGIVVACVVGKPVSYLDCNAFPSKGSTAAFLNSLFANVKRLGDNTFEWVGPSKPSCLQLKSIWGISIAMCALFTLSTATTACLWRRLKCSAPPPPKDLE